MRAGYLSILLCGLVVMGCHDADDDGYRRKHDNDCDDEDASINPGAQEICDGIDNDCNGYIDDNTADPATWYVDADGDGFGNPNQSYLSCAAPPGWIADATDCDDGNALSFPGNIEVCDGFDNDCNDQIDEGTTAVFYADEDGDAFGNAEASWEGCEAPPGWVGDGTDCDDGDARSFPGNTEVCDEVDNDCNDQVDEGVLVTFHADMDGDLAGDPNTSFEACEAPPGWVQDATDCDDDNASAFAGNPEICDLQDNNCDDNVDEDVGQTFYPDNDGDGFGLSTQSYDGCLAPAGWVTKDGDCDDALAVNFPGNTEVCDHLDNDCDGTADNGVLVTFYADADGDQYGAASSPYLTCTAPPGFVLDSTDCDDGNYDVWPGALDICDGIDGDCDGVLDNSGYDSDGDLLDNCNDPTVYDESFADCVGDSSSFAALGWSVLELAAMASGNGSGPSLGLPVVGTPTMGEDWAWCSLLESGATAGGHSMALGIDHGELNVFTIRAQMQFGGLVNAGGIVWEYRDPGNFFLVRWDDPEGAYTRSTKIELIRCINDACAVLQSLDPAPQAVSGANLIEIRVAYDVIDVYTGGTRRVSTITNGGDIGPGVVGAYSFATPNGVWLDDLTIVQP